MLLLNAYADADTEAKEKPDSINVVGLLGNKVILMVNGKRIVLRAGETGPNSIKLIESARDFVILDVKGKQAKYYIGNAPISTNYKKSTKTDVKVYKDISGMYRTIGVVNGYPVKFLVDTGASTVAMNSGHAKRLGINYLMKGSQVNVNTASGVASAYHVKLNSVAVGSIKLYNIDAVVIQGNSPNEILLGMSFLGRMKVEYQGEVMSITPQY